MAERFLQLSRDEQAEIILGDRFQDSTPEVERCVENFRSRPCPRRCCAVFRAAIGGAVRRGVFSSGSQRRRRAVADPLSKRARNRQRIHGQQRTGRVRRSITEPSHVYELRPYIADVVAELIFPVARADVLSPVRTFWEKATLIHVECHRNEFRPNVERLSRHWYDLAMLVEHDVGAQALEDRELLADVVKHKKVFFNASYANYDACISGGFRLLPEKAVLGALQTDFRTDAPGRDVLWRAAFVRAHRYTPA